MNASMILALPLVWVACAIAGYLYSQQQHIPAAIALAALPAFLLEATLFYVLGVERLRALGGIAALAAAASFWYVLLPEKPATDVLFLVLLALVYLVKLFHRLYVSPHPKLPLETLGQLMWIRTGALALLSVRGVKGVGF